MTSITNKRQMYQMLAAGAFGNTVPQWFDLPTWQNEGAARYPLWGIRSGIAGGDKRMRLNVPTSEVADIYRTWFPQGGGNLSPMIDTFAKLRAEVMVNSQWPYGLQVHYADGYDPSDPDPDWTPGTNWPEWN